MKVIDLHSKNNGGGGGGDTPSPSGDVDTRTYTGGAILDLTYDTSVGPADNPNFEKVGDTGTWEDDYAVKEDILSKVFDGTVQIVFALLRGDDCTVMTGQREYTYSSSSVVYFTYGSFINSGGTAIQNWGPYAISIDSSGIVNPYAYPYD